ncbi:MAG: LacI family DNA-binding transcriptional regulator [Paracoccaceae bacterium]
MIDRKVTSTHVAALAGVSQSAVSRVFTPGAPVAKATEARVRKAAAELGYRPNVLARAMVSGKTRIIGVMMAYLDNQFYPTALEKLSEALQAQGYHVLVFMASNTREDVDGVLQQILDYQVEGIILASVSLSSDVAARCRAVGVPVVLFNRHQDDKTVSSVTSDNRAGGREVARFLAAGGHTRISYIAGWEGASTQRDREAGFCAGLAEADRDLFARAVGGYDNAATKVAAFTLFNKPEDQRPDAVFVANDHMALIVMDILRFELGLDVPGEVSVVGFDDVPGAAWLAYQLTTLRQRANRMVEATVAALLDQIEDPGAAPYAVRVAAPLILRKSARVPAGWPQSNKRDIP